ncbi:MaoC/PaaZ C-terminal domain-containing protein [Pseudalkalibacillus sp. Hm43]|uniref:MaoC/PaaZ C-terminal domain-containing protein n=1 Tax=Pseudalkalibacillus sp. Hm43 TaxID=3450742 RepID=UPI003F44277B
MSTTSHELHFTDQDISDYADVSGDHNPIHTSVTDAKKMGFESCPVHGMLVMARVGGYCRRFAAQGKFIHDISVRFQAPVFTGESYRLEFETFDQENIQFTLTLKGGHIVMKGTASTTSR